MNTCTPNYERFCQRVYGTLGKNRESAYCNIHIIWLLKSPSHMKLRKLSVIRFEPQRFWFRQNRISNIFGTKKFHMYLSLARGQCGYRTTFMCIKLKEERAPLCVSDAGLVSWTFELLIYAWYLLGSISYLFVHYNAMYSVCALQVRKSKARYE